MPDRPLLAFLAVQNGVAVPSAPVGPAWAAASASYRSCSWTLPRGAVEADLLFRDGQLVVDASARARSDKSLSDWKTAMVKDSESARERVSRLIRNTYRTAMSRGMKRCLVFVCVPMLREYLHEQ